MKNGYYMFVLLSSDNSSIIVVERLNMCGMVIHANIIETKIVDRYSEVAPTVGNIYTNQCEVEQVYVVTNDLPFRINEIGNFTCQSKVRNIIIPVQKFDFSHVDKIHYEVIDLLDVVKCGLGGVYKCIEEVLKLK